MAETRDNPLQRYVWNNRVIAVLAGPEDGAALERQRQVLEAERCGLADRDLVVVDVAHDTVTVDGSQGVVAAADLRRALDVAPTDFAVLLIGKDGGIKLRSDEPVGTDQLFALIDSMPMRRQEMRIHGDRCP